MVMTGNKLYTFGRKDTLLLSMAGIMVLCKTINLCVMWGNIQDVEVQEEHEDVCHISHSAGPDSHACSEHQLFKSWHEATTAEVAKDAEFVAQGDDSNYPRLAQQSNHSPIFMNTSQGARITHGDVKQWLTAAASLLHDNSSNIDTSDRTSQLDEIFNANSEHLQHVNDTAWAHSIEVLQARMEARHDRLRSVHKKHSQIAHETFVELINKTADAIQHGSPSKWAQHLEHTKDVLEARLRERKLVRQQHRAEMEKHGLNVASSHHSHHNESLESWTQSIMDLQTHIKSVYDENRARIAEIAKAKANQAKLDILANFTSHSAESHSAPSKRALRAQSGQQTQERQGQQSSPSASRAQPRRAFRGSTYQNSLEWRHVKTWRSAQPASKIRGTTVLSTEQLRQAHWQGMMPKVACIAAIPSGDDARARVQHFIENWNLQTYEGPRQLILVYSHSDHDLRHLLQIYADGTFVKAVAARSNGAVPSTLALRFGAWSAEADIIARWDFISSGHQPQRLAMQVHALATAVRPACLMKQLDDVSDTKISGDPSSIIGEISWMREHWQPLLKEEHAVLTAAQAHNVVIVQGN